MRAYYIPTIIWLMLILSFTKSSEQIIDNGRTTPFRPNPGAVIPPTFTLNQRALPAIKVDTTGKVYTTQILKQQLANELRLPLRDLRLVDPSFPSQIQATFIARKRAILFCIENIKVVVQHNEALVFSPYQPDVQEFVPALQQQILQNTVNDGINPGVSTRFEHIVIEAALNVVCGNLLRRVRALSPAIAAALNDLRAESRGLDVIQTQVDELLPLKNKVDELKSHVKEIKRAICEVLENDEHLGMMYLCPEQPYSSSIESTSLESAPIGTNPATVISNNSISSSDMSSSVGKGTKSNDTNKIIEVFDSDSLNNNNYGPSCIRGGDDMADTMSLEMLFENYLNEVEWINSEIDDLLDEITNTEENVVLQLDLLRNRILRFELTLSISSFVVTCGALVTGLFGMNLLNHMEFQPKVFYLVTAILTFGMSGLYIAMKKYGKQMQLF